ncbi:MAG: hypothetical protein WCO75_06640 [Planctomycetota bacterium]
MEQQMVGAFHIFGWVTWRRAEVAVALLVVVFVAIEVASAPRPARDWSDASYLAERVLDEDELRCFVDSLADGHLPEGQAPLSEWRTDLNGAGELRFLLARRLVRAGRLTKALDYCAADRFYKSLVRRCRETPVGREAARVHWFPAKSKEAAG